MLQKQHKIINRVINRYIISCLQHLVFRISGPCNKSGIVMHLLHCCVYVCVVCVYLPLRLFCKRDFPFRYFIPRQYNKILCILVFVIATLLNTFRTRDLKEQQLLRWFYTLDLIRCVRVRVGYVVHVMYVITVLNCWTSLQGPIR